MRRPPRMCGSADGSLSCHSVCSARRAVEREQLLQIAVDGIQPERRVRQHRKERDDPGAGDHRHLLRQVDQQQRRDRHHRRHLQDDGVGIERVFDQPRAVEQERQRDAADGRGEKPFERGDQRHQQRVARGSASPGSASRTPGAARAADRAGCCSAARSGPRPGCRWRASAAAGAKRSRLAPSPRTAAVRLLRHHAAFAALARASASDTSRQCAT